MPSPMPSTTLIVAARRLAAGLVAVALITGCSVTVSPTAQHAAAPPSSRSSSPTGRASSGPGPDKLLVVMEENRSSADVAQNMPYLSSVGARYGHTSRYHALAHPSLPNYLAIAGGSRFGVTDDDNPSAHHLSGASVFGQLLASGRTVKTYAEAMNGNCATRNHGRYAVRHNPWTYFSDPRERAACARNDVPAGTTTAGPLTDDIRAGQLPTFALVIPDTCHDGHDCSAGTADAWLHSWLPLIQSGPDFTDGRLTVIVTWDEDDASDGNRIACVVAHPSLAGRVVDDRLDHYALSAAISSLAGQPPLRRAATSPDLLRAFGLT